MCYNKHNIRDEKRNRFSFMCLLNRSEASRFAACTYGIISTRRVCVQIVWQNERREGACSFRAIRVTTFGGSKPPPYGQTRCGASASKALPLRLWYNIHRKSCFASLWALPYRAWAQTVILTASQKCTCKQTFLLHK